MDLSPPVSPTGKAVLSPASVPYIAALFAALSAGVQALPDGSLRSVALAVIPALGVILGMLSPGLRSKS